MISRGLLWKAQQVVLFGSICVQCVLGSPAVNVALRASFPQPPLLLELLESAADENAAAYFPLLDRIADGAFADTQTDQQLYEKFLRVLVEERHLPDPQAVSSWKLAVAVHNSAPRIEAQYQFYRTSIEASFEEGDDNCKKGPILEVDGSRQCSLESGRTRIQRPTSHKEELAFDRIYGNVSADSPYVLYADPTARDFGDIYRTIVEEARRKVTASFRLRYKPAVSKGVDPLAIHGYGVSLDLKRTDYIVIDDRQDAADDVHGASKPGQVALEEEDEVSDVRKLTSAELLRLGLRASSFVMNAEEKLGTLLRMTQDFPKHAAAVSAFNVSDAFLDEHKANRELLLNAGVNVLWVNGQQIDARKVNPFDLLEHLRRERILVTQAKDVGLTGREVIDLFTHSAITDAQIKDDVPRYDWRDETEGGKVIAWLNDIEKDKRYADWDGTLAALLQRTFPGQMPPVRRDIHNIIMPIDFTSTDGVEIVVERLQTFVKRKIGPVRFGLVPIVSTDGAVRQAKVVYHLLDTYGLGSLLEYLAASLKAGSLGEPHGASFEYAIKARKPRPRQVASSLSDLLASDKYNTRLKSLREYLQRLGADGVSPPFFVNGAVVSRNEQWLSAMSQRLTQDQRDLQQQIYEGAFEEDHWLPGYLLLSASLRRNALIIPEDRKSLKFVSLGEVLSAHMKPFSLLRRIVADPATEPKDWVQLLVIDDFGSDRGLDRLKELTDFRKEHNEVEVIFMHNQPIASEIPEVTAYLSPVDGQDGPVDIDHLETLLSSERARKATKVKLKDSIWLGIQALLNDLQSSAEQRALLVNGRVVGPLGESATFAKDDLETLISYERKERIAPVVKALDELEIIDRFGSVDSMAIICSLISVSTVSNAPEGIFDDMPTTRTNVFDQVLTHEKTAIITGDLETASLRIVAAIDPVSETAQRWVPLLETLSRFEGTYMRLYLNPREKMTELPVKRFYRYVLNNEPQFDGEGSLRDLQAEFKGIPSETLLTMAMDVPPSWLVAPEISIYDLDNIKLGSISGNSVDAVYKLENILIEGHTRDSGSDMPPRGAKLELGTEDNPHFADTTIMANLGYFQFKANPGFYNIELQKGPSRNIFTIDSIGAQGWGDPANGQSTEVALTSFRGLTLYPRMSRRPGRETDDVLETPASPATEALSKGAAVVDDVLSKVGLKSVDSGKYISRAIDFGSSVLSNLGKGADGGAAKQADINIFSVASGHLYERMLNIMMVSVMRHTNHTVKFWFIEQFLSPSFKSFLPTMASTYGFRYELVTYKWPHWLRQQKEKQREIWGYKILFLDVLFPLDLDKVIFVDADQIVRTDMHELVSHELEGAPYGFTPMCDSRTEMEGFRFWKQGYWKNFLRGLPYHISALYVVDLKRFRQIAAGDRLRQQYHQLSADPNSLSNLDQDLPNNMQFNIPIHSLPQEWLWCETWCSDESLKDAKTIDLCNNPQTKEPKLERARRQVPEWTEYDDEIAALVDRTKGASRAAGKEQERQQELEYSSAKGSAASSSAAASQSDTGTKKHDEL